MSLYTGGFAPQQQNMQAQSPLMAPQQPNYQQQMAMALSSPQMAQGGGMPDMASIMKLMQQFNGMQAGMPTQTPAPIVDHSFPSE
jgi:hypothetical protein